MDPAKVEAILHWPHPTNVEELQFFLRLACFYQKFTHEYAKIVVLMTYQFKAKGRQLFWDDAQ